MNWKEEIGLLFSDKKLFRLDYLNDNLSKIVEKWASYINSFKGIQANIGSKFYDAGIKAITLTIRSQTITELLLQPLEIIIYYKLTDDEKELCLHSEYIKFIKEIDEGKILGDDKKSEALRQKYLHKNEFTNPEEIHEEEFILFHLNSILKDRMS